MENNNFILKILNKILAPVVAIRISTEINYRNYARILNENYKTLPRILIENYSDCAQDLICKLEKAVPRI